ncbi:MAG: peptide chain release factor N(5)-glutamine methyltransferase [Oscillospiraceae bacterium]|nr:peptide chain release factor N(5)-glutamine methyltransferase [Oscillospiraceae bacterium]
MTTEHQMPEGLEGLGEMLVEMDPRMAAGMVAGMLQASGCPDPDFDAVELTRLVTGQDPRLSETTLTEEQAARLARLAALRFERRPLQYIEGKWGFLDFEVQVGEGVLIPRQDSEAICLKAIDLLKGQAAPAVLDLCAGSGCLGLAVKSRCPAARVTAVEKSAEALPWLQKNAAEALPGFDAAHPALNVQQGDVFQWNKGQAEGQFDLILANPPYLTAEEMRTLQPEVEFEPAMALDGGEDGLDFYRHIAKAYRPLTKPGGWLVMEFGWQQWEPVKALLEAAGWQDVQRILDAEGRDRGAAARNG